MHGGLPMIGVSVLVYGAVGVAVIVRRGLRWCRQGCGAGWWRGLRRSRCGGTGVGQRERERGSGAWAAASR